MSNYFVQTLLHARNWQHRPQFDEVTQWWRDGGQGVCALVGMGGAGKTAIAERFLKELLDDSRPTRQRLNPPLSVFVYSFYDDDKPENFFRHLQIWLEGNSAPDKQKSPTQLMFDIQQHQGLIILDGLERVQESGARGGFGRLASPSLRELLNHIACGSAREISVLVTSRFPLTDLRDRQPRFFHAIAIDQIDVAAGVALLRERGVRGTDVQLALIVEHCGRHALTIDLAGGYIKEYGHGAPSTPLNLGTAEDLQAEAEQEPDDDKRAVLKQGIRFARIAQRYREAMLENDDEAGLALLERICLFRRGVDCETLAAIFLDDEAYEISGKALWILDASQLQRKLDWLVRMRIVEQSESSTWNTVSSRKKTIYSIHPAVRDGFLAGFGQELASAGHNAVRRNLVVSLGAVPSENPSDPAILDVLEEIIHHSINAGLPREAWMILYDRMGGLQYLMWEIGDFARCARICRRFVSGSPPKIEELQLDTEKLVSFLSDFAMILNYTGASDESRRLLQNVEMLFDQYAPGCADATFTDALIHFSAGRLVAVASSLSSGHQNCFEYWLRSSGFQSASPLLGLTRVLLGDLKLGLASFLKSRYLSSLADLEVEEEIRDRHRVRDIEFDRLREIDHPDDMDEDENDYLFQLDSQFARSEGDQAAEFILDLDALPPAPGLGYDSLMFAEGMLRLGRLEEAEGIALQIHEEAVADGRLFAECSVLMARIMLAQQSGDHGRSAIGDAYQWAIAHDAKEILCLSALNQIRIEVRRIRLVNHDSEMDEPETEANLLFANVLIWAEQGIRLVRACGYGIHHIDLLLERARLHLLRGDPAAALDDIEVSLDVGIPANEETGQVEMLAAMHEECGYAWAIPVGLQLRAEALLLQAAQELIHGKWALSTSDAQLAPIALEAVVSAHPTFAAGIERARQLLHEAIEHWQPLHDPEPEREDQNFKLDGKEYNYRAAETHQVLVNLDNGTLTKYPLNKAASEIDSETTIGSIRTKPEARKMSPFDTFLSHNSKDKPDVRRLGEALRKRNLTVWLDEWELRPGLSWQDALEEIISNCRSAAVCVGDNGIGPWEDPEMKALLRRFVAEKRIGNVVPIIPVLLPGAPDNVKLPLFLEEFTWVDLRGGLKSDALDRLEWGITGVKPKL